MKIDTLWRSASAMVALAALTLLSSSCFVPTLAELEYLSDSVCLPRVSVAKVSARLSALEAQWDDRSLNAAWRFETPGGMEGEQVIDEMSGLLARLGKSAEVRCLAGRSVDPIITRMQRLFQSVEEQHRVESYLGRIPYTPLCPYGHKAKWKWYFQKPGACLRLASFCSAASQCDKNIM